MKFIRIITLIIVILTFSYATVFAFDLGNVITNAGTFLSNGATQASGANVDTAIGGTIQGLAAAGLAIGTIVAICVGIVVAIQAMSSGAYGKAQLKELLTPYIIGIVVLFAAWTIWAAVVEMMESAIA